jgi:NTE family protein
MDFNWGKGGLIKGDKVMNRLGHLLGDLNIEDLSIPYTAVAADISNEKEVWLQKGPLLQAMRASISLPLYLMPIELNGRTLIDGGVLNPVPIAPTFGDHSDITLAVNLAGEMTHQIDDFADKQIDISEAESEGDTSFHRKVSDYFGSLTAKTSRIDLGMYDIANQAFDAMQSTIARQKLGQSVLLSHVPFDSSVSRAVLKECLVRGRTRSAVKKRGKRRVRCRVIIHTTRWCCLFGTHC